METDIAANYREESLIECLAETLGFGWVSEQLPVKVYPPYLLVATGLFIDYGVVDTYNFFISGRSSIVDDPISIIVALGIIIAVGGIHWMRDAYAEAVADLRIHERENHQLSDMGISFSTIVPFRYKVLS